MLQSAIWPQSLTCETAWLELPWDQKLGSKFENINLRSRRKIGLAKSKSMLSVLATSFWTYCKSVRLYYFNQMNPI